jgi:hypothetical protein
MLISIIERRPQGQIQIPPSNPKPGQANPNKIAWFYSSESGLINGLQGFQIRIFLLPFLARRDFASDYRDNIA